jgi:hypothetical protein
MNPEPPSSGAQLILPSTYYDHNCGVYCLREKVMEYEVYTMIGDCPIENQRPSYSHFTELVKAIDAAREQHAKTATAKHYTMVSTQDDDVFYLIHQGVEYTPTSKPTALEKVDELGELLTGLSRRPFSWVQH